MIKSINLIVSAGRPGERKRRIRCDVSYLKGPKEKRIGAGGGDGHADMEVAKLRCAENDSFQRVQVVGNDIQFGFKPLKVVMDAGLPENITNIGLQRIQGIESGRQTSRPE